SLTADGREVASTPDTPQRSGDDIRHDNPARRESISEAVDRLSDRFQRTLDWRAYVSDYPLAAIGVAAGVGFLVGRIFKPRPSAGERIKDALAYGIEDFTGRIRNQLDDLAPRRSRSGGRRTGKAPATALLTQEPPDYLQNRYDVRYQQYTEYRPEYTNADDISSY